MDDLWLIEHDLGDKLLMFEAESEHGTVLYAWIRENFM